MCLLYVYAQLEINKDRVRVGPKINGKTVILKFKLFSTKPIDLHVLGLYETRRYFLALSCSKTDHMVELT